MNTTKKLRNCSATVNIIDKGFATVYELVSYATPVACYGFVDRYTLESGEDFTGWMVLLADEYDCSNTTMMHVRKFIDDYVKPDQNVNISDIRMALKTDNILCTCQGYQVACEIIGSW